MRTRIAAIISFLSGIVTALFTLYFIYKDGFGDGNELLFELVFMLFTASTIIYVIWTKFGKMSMTELEKIEYENQLLKKKVEQKELKKKLEE